MLYVFFFFFPSGSFILFSSKEGRKTFWCFNSPWSHEEGCSWREGIVFGACKQICFFPTISLLLPSVIYPHLPTTLFLISLCILNPSLSSLPIQILNLEKYYHCFSQMVFLQMITFLFFNVNILILFWDVTLTLSLYFSLVLFSIFWILH
jgi:hypothetical protein